MQEGEPKKIVIHPLKPRPHLFAEMNIKTENIGFSMKPIIFEIKMASNMELFQPCSFYQDFLNQEEQRLARKKEIEEAEKRDSRHLHPKGASVA